MAKGRPCKICKLQKSNPEAFIQITQQILKDEKGTMARFLRELNKEYATNIILMNVRRHKTHMEGNVIEIKGDAKTGEDKNSTAISQTSLSSHFTSVTLPQLDAKYIKFLEKYRENGYRSKEKAWLDAGFKRAKDVYDIMKKPEIKAAIYEMKATDFVAMRYTGNQVLAGLMEIAHFPEYWEKACDKNGDLKTNIKKWPEELRNVLSGFESTEDVIKSSSDDNDGIVVRRRYKFKFPDPLKARMELRKHAMEIQMYQQGGNSQEKVKIYESIIEKLLLNQINPIAAGLEMGKHNIDVPDALKIAMQKVDPNVLDKPPLIELDNMSDYSDEELERIASGDID